MTVSVIVPAYNAASTLPRVLDALTKQDYKNAIEIIVVDDGSTDDTPRVIAQFPQVMYIHQTNAGPAAARNHGAQLASGDFLCFTDSDCIPHIDWISLLIKGFSAANIGVVCGSYGIANPQHILARGIHAEIIFRHSFLMPNYPKAFGSYNFCVRKQVFEKVGGFNTIYRQASGEDNDLSYRIIKAGFRIFFMRSALVDHYHTIKLVKYLNEQFRHGYWRASMYFEHPDMMKGDDYTFWKDILEVPWAGLCLLALLLSCLNVVSFKSVLYFLFLLFFIFEIVAAQRMLQKIFEAIYFGFVMYLRAFARTFGLSTGIFNFFLHVIKKKFK